MTRYTLAQVASNIARDPKLEVVSKPTHLARVATEVQQDLRVAAIKDQDAEWHRVNSYIADILKDAHVLYAKLARLQSDFADAELVKLEKISERVLELGEHLSQFSKGFYEGRIEMVKEFSYSGPGGSTEVEVANPEQSEESEEPSEEELDIALDLEGESDFTDYEEEGEPKEASTAAAGGSGGEGRGEGGEGGVEEEGGEEEEKNE